MEASSTAPQAAEVVTMTSLLTGHRDVLKRSIATKTAKSPFDNAADIIKRAEQLLLKVARELEDPRAVEAGVRELIGASSKLRGAESAWRSATDAADKVYLGTQPEPQPLGQLFAELQKKTVVAAPETAELWKTFQKLIERRAQGGQEDDVEMVTDENVPRGGEAKAEFICPISKKIMKEPMVHEPCSHHFDKVSIDEMIKSKQGMPFNCPVRGCKKKIEAHKLKLDELLRMDIEEFLNSEAQQKKPKKKKATSKSQEDEEEEEPASSSKKKSAKKPRRSVIEDDDVEDD